MTVRTRVAPSPTGDPHVGTAYIALFNRAFAKQHGGEFLLRIEDTDQQRSSPESEQAIMAALTWLGLTWDEGPGVGGDKGPYRQSERSQLYRQHAQQLVDQGHAFPCFCSEERLTAVREQQRQSGEALGYDGHCQHLPATEVAERLAQGQAHVVRMVVPREGDSVFQDMLRGDISIPWTQVDNQVLLKSDGLPSYHLANVIDDHYMAITHVIRGEEWISSTPKHQLLYRYFGWQTPVFCHLPLLRNADKSKLSKRKNPTSILYYQKLGILPEVLLNYLGLMGGTMSDEQEVFSFEQMVAGFDLAKMTLGGPVFDLVKLQWLNGRYLREQHTPEQLLARLHEWAFHSQHALQILPLLQQRIETLSDVAPLMLPFVTGLPSLLPEQFAHKKLDEYQVKEVLQFSLWRMETLRTWCKDDLVSIVNQVAERHGVKMRDLMPLYFQALMGTSASVSVLEAMVILGPDLSRARLRHALGVVGGWSKKETKQVDKDYAQWLAGLAG